MNPSASKTEPPSSTRLRKAVSGGSPLIVALLLCALPVSAPAADVAISVVEPSGVTRQGWPVTSGVPFANGALSDDRNVALLTGDGQPVPLQTEVLARWPDGSCAVCSIFRCTWRRISKSFPAPRWGSRPTVLTRCGSVRDHRTKPPPARIRADGPFGAWTTSTAMGKLQR